MECERGCLTRYHGTSLAECNDTCVSKTYLSSIVGQLSRAHFGGNGVSLILLVFQLNQCQDECRGECGPEFVPPCGLNCERRPCDMGCTMYEDLVSQGEHKSRPHCSDAADWNIIHIQVA